MALNYNVLIRLRLKWNAVSLVLGFSFDAKTVTVFSVSSFAIKVEFTVVHERPNTLQSSVMLLAIVVLVFFGVWRRSSAFGAWSSLEGEGGDNDAVERRDDGVSGCWLLVSSSI